MFTKRVLFIDNERISHNNIKKLEIDFTSPFQLFLGTNGCGKSSLLRQMTVFPSTKDELGENAYREIDVEFNGSLYTAIDDHRLGKFSLIKDGEIINDKSTATVQKNLIQQIFGLDKTLVDILTDKLLFTEMSPAQRREIIMRASKINIEKGLELLDFIGERNNYLKQYSKNLAKRLIDEEKSLPTESHIQELNHRRQEIIDDLNLLDEMGTQPVDTADKEELLERLTELKKRAKFVAIRFNDTPAILHGAKDEMGALDVRSRLRYEVESISGRQDQLTLEIEAVENQLHAATKNENVSLEDFVNERDSLISQIESIEEEGGEFLYLGEGYRQAVNSSQTLYEELRGIFSELADNSNGYFSKEKKIANVEKIIAIGNQIKIYRDSVYELEHELKKHVHGEHVSCPKCKHDFIPGVYGTMYDAEDKLKQSQIKLSQFEKMLEEEKNYQVEINKFQNALLEVERLNRHYTQHSHLFVKLKEYGYNSNAPGHCLVILSDWFKSCGLSIRYNELHQRLDAVKECIRLYKLEDAQKRKEQEVLLEKYNDEYNVCIDKKQTLNEQIKDIDQYLKYVSGLKEWIRETEMLSLELEEFKDQLLNNMQHKFVLESKAQLNGELAGVDSELNKVTYSILNRDKLIKEKEELDETKELTAICMAELSPKTGILGDVMNSFIREFVGHMNNIISSVWTYSMEILECRNKKGDLDFYFPVLVQGKTEPNPDVADTSGAQSKIINFAFKWLMMKTHDLTHYPLFLDEFTNGMDEVHIVRMIKLAYDMVETERCSQLFMILHQANQFGSFPQAESLVINADNLQTLPDHYNTHAKFS